MIKIIRKRERHTEYDHHMVFDLIEEPSCGFSFPCDENGIVDTTVMTDLQKQSLAIALDESKYHKPELRSYVRRWTDPAIGECEVCTRSVLLSSSTNACKCGADYNVFGQRLAPRHQWGEETGEHWTECW